MRLDDELVDLLVRVAPAVRRPEPLSGSSVTTSEFIEFDISPESAPQPARYVENSNLLRRVKKVEAVIASMLVLMPTRVSICAIAWAIFSSLM